MIKRVIKLISIFLVILMISLGIWVNITYSPNQRALAYTVETEKVKIVEEDFGTSFIPLEGKKASGIIFYPGAKVEGMAYSPLAFKLAEKGYMTTVVEMPFNLAVIDKNRGIKVIKHYESIEKWYIGGHSLGGAMAGSFASDNDELLKGVFFLGAYPAENLSNSSLDVLLVNGTLDAIINGDRLAKVNDLIPKDGKNLVIQGANHSQFGAYGLQKNDQEAEISYQEQEDQTIELMLNWLKNKN